MSATYTIFSRNKKNVPMPVYTPIHIEPQFPSHLSDMHHMEYINHGIKADFYIPGEPPKFLRIEFEQVDLVRFLDEGAISTEEANLSSDLGLISEHFAYTVEGSTFWKSQSEIVTHLPNLKHYRFVTGWTCLDVLARTKPAFSVVSRG